MVTSPVMLFSHVPVEILLSCLLSGDQAAKPRDLQGALFHRPVHRQLELSEIRESTVICFYWCTLCSLHNWPPTAPFTSTCTHSRCDRLTQCHALYAHLAAFHAHVFLGRLDSCSCFGLLLLAYSSSSKHAYFQSRNRSHSLLQCLS